VATGLHLDEAFQEATMRIVLLACILVPLLALSLAAIDPKAEPAPTPLMRTVDPMNTKVGAEVLVTGDNLGTNCIAEVFLTAANQNFKVEVTSQTEKELKFKVPQVKAGAYKLLVLTKSVEPVLIEEPVRVVIEE
jgi:hypothetical protein